MTMPRPVRFQELANRASSVKALEVWATESLAADGFTLGDSEFGQQSMRPRQRDGECCPNVRGTRRTVLSNQQSCSACFRLKRFLSS